MFAALLLCNHFVWSLLDRHLAAAKLAAGDVPTEGESGASTPTSRNSESFGELCVTFLEGLESLLRIWLPAVLNLGYLVRDCHWNGRPGGVRKGRDAKRVLQHALVMLASLRGDWACKEEYTRTVAVALLSWQGWMDGIPACCWVEESCEALLGRAKERLHNHRYMRGFETAVDLYVTLSAGKRGHVALAGGVKAELVPLFKARLEYFIQSQFRQNDVYAKWAANGKSSWSVGCAVESFPGRIEWDAAQGEELLQGALVSLMNRARPQGAVRLWLDDNVPLAPASATVMADAAYEQVQRWASDRAGRDRLQGPRAGMRRRRPSQPAVADPDQSESESGSGDDSESLADPVDAPDGGDDSESDLDSPYI
jgi:hypothetical protein